MSTFAVFGMTRSVATASARRVTPSVRGGVEVPLEEWELEVIKRADKIMSGARVVQLCKPFDAPQFAREFIQLARKHEDCRDLRIRARAPKKDAFGAPLKNKKGAPVIGWQEWKGA